MPFLRLEYAEKNEIAGAGIGLYQAQYLVNEMKGTLTFESLPKQGSLFFVRLPLNKSE